VLSINANDPDDLAQALCHVWSSSARVEGDFRRDVIIMEMIDAQISGVTYSEHEYQDDFVLANEENLQLAKLWAIESVSSDDLADWAKRLQKLLRQIRREFGDKNWEIQWADDGQNCYLIGLRPIINPPQHDEEFVLLEHESILPSFFLSELATSCSSKIYQHYRQFDKTLPKERKLIKMFRGRAYLNQSLLNDTLRHWGLFAFNWRRMLIKTAQLVLPKLALSYLRPQSREFPAENLDTSFAEIIEAASGLYIEWIALQLPILRRANLVYEARIQEGLLMIRKAMMKQAQVLVEQGILPEANCIWLLKLDELRQLDENWLPSDELFEQRRAEIEENNYSDVPEQIQSTIDRENPVVSSQQAAKEVLISPKTASA
jgi:hypothetical protein